MRRRHCRPAQPRGRRPPDPRPLQARDHLLAARPHRRRLQAEARSMLSRGRAGQADTNRVCHRHKQPRSRSRATSRSRNKGTTVAAAGRRSPQHRKDLPPPRRRGVSPVRCRRHQTPCPGIREPMRRTCRRQWQRLQLRRQPNEPSPILQLLCLCCGGDGLDDGT